MNKHKLLLIDCSPRSGKSTSRHFTHKLLPKVADKLETEFEVTVRHLGGNTISPITEDYAESVLIPLADAEEKFQLSLADSDELIKEVVDADLIWISTPVHNFTIPAVLKNWIDLIVRKDVTFTSTKNGKVGLLQDKPTFVAVTSGGAMFMDPPIQPDFFRPYLTAILGTIGLKNLTFITATGLASASEPYSFVETKANEWLDDFDFSKKS